MISKNKLSSFLDKLVPVDDDCVYNPNKKSCFKVFKNHDFLEPNVIDWMLANGIKRFGSTYYQNTCLNCDGCLYYRILLNSFVFFM